MQQVYLAVDIGGSSGRVVAGEFDGQKVVLEEVYRFDNGGTADTLKAPFKNAFELRVSIVERVADQFIIFS